jgi:cell division protease FtsH
VAEPRKNVQFTYLALALLLALAVNLWLTRSGQVPIDYSDFKALVRGGHVHEVLISPASINGTADLSAARATLPEAARQRLPQDGTGGELRFSTLRIDDPTLVTDLESARVRYAGGAGTNWLMQLLAWVAPALIFVAIWALVLGRMGNKQMGDLVGIGKSKARVYVQKNIGVTFADVEGIDEAKAELMEVVEFLKTPERYTRLGGRIPKGVLIVGAPGTGKTLLAKAVAGEANVPFLSISGSEFVEMFVGVGAARVRDLFDQAEKLAPCIIFIDELDALGKARGAGGFGGHEEREQTLNQLLVELDGFDTNKGVIIMAATNRPEILDPALLRPGRFDRKVAIDRPDIRGRERILKLHAGKLALDPDVDLGVVAAKTPGFAGADLANIVNEAALRAARQNQKTVTQADFDAAIERVITGLEKKNRVMNPKEKETVAYHEAGHALIAEKRPTTDKVSKVSIIPRGIGALGFTQQLPTEDRYLMKRSELLDRLDVLLGGRVAEQLAFGEVSTGAQNDLQRATDLARHMVAQYGMGETLGPAVVDTRPANPFLGELGMPRGECSEQTARQIDEEVRQLLKEAEDRVHATLESARQELEALAKMLLARETVDREALLALLADRSPSAEPPAAGSRIAGIQQG